MASLNPFDNTEKSVPLRAVSLVRNGDNGGAEGIRTLETVPRLHTFQACAFDHSATAPTTSLSNLETKRQASRSETCNAFAILVVSCRNASKHGGSYGPFSRSSPAAAHQFHPSGLRGSHRRAANQQCPNLRQPERGEYAQPPAEA